MILRALVCAGATCAAIGIAVAQEQDEQPEVSVVEQLKDDARRLEPLAQTALGLRFLEASELLVKDIEPRTFLYRKSDRAVVPMRDRETIPEEELDDFAEMTWGAQQYYNLFSPPTAWLRPLDILALHGVDDFEGLRVLDFGFGNIGHLKMLAGLGSNVTGIEIKGFPYGLYDERDQGTHTTLPGIDHAGSVSLAFGYWPAEPEMLESVGIGFDVFISKNVLKYGYIHPEREASPLQLVHLGVDDATFLQHLYSIMNSGGHVLVYNLYPPMAGPDEDYKPWAYGENPWARELVAQTGFEIIAWNVPDSEAIHEFGRVIGWDANFETEEEFKRNFLSMYTVFRKP